MAISGNHSLSKHYNEKSEVGVLSSNLFYVGDTGRVNANGHPIEALYCTDLNDRTMELIEGVEFLQVSYGLKENIHQFLSADKVTNWQSVAKIRVSLLLNSIEDGLLEPKKYHINDLEIIPQDRLLRKWWTFEYAIKRI